MRTGWLTPETQSVAYHVTDELWAKVLEAAGPNNERNLQILAYHLKETIMNGEPRVPAVFTDLIRCAVTRVKWLQIVRCRLK